ncbi:MAG: glycosyltransferase family 9 protein [Candidatus Omnitrophica bacterium]|nr:glycosyltransferase family 9 protein [Candidatus Omnitrophota bacterium]MDD5435949.1 glycosyltransferase family 9 protein [Candidatus Omnitrophota bacterium]
MKILITNPFGIGDVIFSTPLIEVVRKVFPRSYIGYICNRRVSELIKTNPHLNKVFVYEKDEYREIWRRSKIRCVVKAVSFLRNIKREKFDISIDLSLNYQCSMLFKLIGIKTRAGFNYRNRGRFLTHKIDIESFDNKHVVEHYLDVLRLLGINVSRDIVSPKVYASATSLSFGERFLEENHIGKTDLLIGMVPGCGASWGQDASRRRWDRKKFAALANRLIEECGARVVLLGNSKETVICEEVRAGTGGRALNYSGKTSIEKLIGILARCKVVITNEGGMLHMAAGLGVRTVSLFGPVDEATYGPYPRGADHTILSRKDMPCRPCYKKFKYNICDERRCLDTITVDEVFRAAEEAIKR